jgi:sarcosine oxidase subunit alpha
MTMAQRTNRVEVHPVLGPAPEREVIAFSFNGQRLSAYAGEVIAAALMAHGIRDLGTSGSRRAPRGIYCAIGHCYACQVTVDGRPGVRACLTPLRDGMQVTTDAPPANEKASAG